MKIWVFYDPSDHAYAQAGLRGTWTPPEEGPERRIQPLIIEWEPGSDVIGDFTCTGFGSGWVVTEEVGEMLLARFKGFELGPVEMIQDPKLKRTRQITRRAKRRVWLPYDGPPLYEVWATHQVKPDLDRSTLANVRRDEGTDELCYDVEGEERIEYSGVFPDLCRKRVPREQGKGIYVVEADLDGADIFDIEGCGWIFCTHSVREFIIEQQFTNVDFFEMGETF
jgi:hypothetical protein